MLTLSKTQMKKYDYDDYDIYIQDVGDYWESWLCRKGYGVIDYMFGIPKNDHYIAWDGKDWNKRENMKEWTEEMFLERVEAFLPDYIEDYNEQHERED